MEVQKNLYLPTCPFFCSTLNLYRDFFIWEEKYKSNVGFPSISQVLIDKLTSNIVVVKGAWQEKNILILFLLICLDEDDFQRENMVLRFLITRYFLHGHTYMRALEYRHTLSLAHIRNIYFTFKRKQIHIELIAMNQLFISDLIEMEKYSVRKLYILFL